MPPRLDKHRRTTITSNRTATNSSINSPTTFHSPWAVGVCPWPSCVRGFRSGALSLLPTYLFKNLNLLLYVFLRERTEADSTLNMELVSAVTYTYVSCFLFNTNKKNKKKVYVYVTAETYSMLRVDGGQARVTVLTLYYWVPITEFILVMAHDYSIRERGIRGGTGKWVWLWLHAHLRKSEGITGRSRSRIRLQCWGEKFEIIRGHWLVQLK